MRNTKIVWSLAALTVMLLGIGVGEYAHLGSTTSQTPLTTAIRAVSPTVRPTSPLPTQSEQTVPLTSLVPRTTASEQTVPLTSAVPRTTASEQTVPSTPAVSRAPTTSTSQPSLPARAPTTSTSQPSLPTRTTVPAHKPVPPTAPLSTQHANAGGGANGAHTSPPVRTAGRSSIASRGGLPPQVAGAPPHKAPKGGQADRVYIVKTHDTLWALAATHLGNPDRWSELFELNRGRAEPGGQLVNPDLIYAGWTLEFPASATGLSPHAASTGTIAANGPRQTSAVLTSTVIGAMAHVTTHRLSIFGGGWFV
jgi:nucleoid-associated protein YgaU